MQEEFWSNIESAHLLLDVLRSAIENSTTDKARRRLLLLLDAIEGELQPFSTSTVGAAT